MKIIAIEGIDGSGKTHQMRLLQEHVKALGKNLVTLEFPNYSSVVGRKIGQLLAGEGPYTAKNLDPMSMALWYAADRKITIEETLPKIADCDILLFNRYTLSNAVYQVMRAPEDQKMEIFHWIFELEHQALRLPEPDLYLIFDVAVEVALENIAKKPRRDYLKGKKKDLYESRATLQKAQILYRESIHHLKNAVLIECSTDSKMVPEMAILRQVQEAVKKTVGWS